MTKEELAKVEEMIENSSKKKLEMVIALAKKQPSKFPEEFIRVLELALVEKK